MKKWRLIINLQEFFRYFLGLDLLHLLLGFSVKLFCSLIKFCLAENDLLHEL